jgi:dinuclear metal center YbgI/SA1388 family protein
MQTVADLKNYFDRFAPEELAEEWDNVGLLVGRQDAAVRKVMTCLTLTDDVAREAIDQKVQLIVTHHPVLFRAVRKLTCDTAEGRSILSLIESGIAVYSPHTRFDSAGQGINQQLAETMQLTDIRPIRLLPESDINGSGRMGTLATPTHLSELLTSLKTALAAEYFEFTGDLNATVSKVAVACGAAAEFMSDAVRHGCDTFVTGEARFHSAIEARQQGINLILLGHYSSERPAVEKLANLIQQQFTDLEVFASRNESDPLTVF